MSEQPIIRPRVMLAIILARYDHGAVPDGVWQVIKLMQAHEGWLQHVADARSPRHPTTPAQR